MPRIGNRLQKNFGREERNRHSGNRKIKAENMKRKSEKKIWIKKALIGIFICVVLYQFRDLIWEGLQEIQKIFLGRIAAACLSLAYMGIEGAVILKMAGQYKNRLSLKKCVGCAYYCAFLRLATLGSGTGIGEIYYLSKVGMNPAQATGMSLIQYMMQKISIALYGGICFLVFYPVIDSYIGAYHKYLLLAVFITAAVITGIILITVPSKCSAFVMVQLDKIGRHDSKWQERINKAKEQVELLQKAATGLLREKKRLCKVFFLDFFKYTCWYLIPFVLYGSDTELTFGRSLIFTALANMLAGVIPAPSGLGALETVFIILFSPVLRRERAISLALVYRFVTTMVPFIVGSIVAWRFSKEQ